MATPIPSPDFPELTREILRLMKRQENAPHAPRDLLHRLHHHPAFNGLLALTDVLLALKTLEEQKFIYCYGDHLSTLEAWKLEPLGKLHAPA